MINRTVLVGRLTKDPELKYTPSGVPMARFTLAVNRPFSNQQGEKEADFINCIAWRKQAENLSNFMKKGNMVGIEGRIQTGSFEGQDGKRVFTTDVVADSIQFLERNQQSQSNHQQSSQQQYGGQQNYTRMDEDPFANSKGPIEVSEDDLPFDLTGQEGGEVYGVA